MKLLTPHQREVLTYLSTVDTATLQEIYENVNFGYYNNWSKYMSMIMTRLVTYGRVVRVKKGVFKINSKNAEFNSAHKGVDNKNQTELFK
jgi:hypothetical protein